MHQFTSVFYKTLEAFVNPDYNLIVSQGGQGSSKTISICQLLFLKAKMSKVPVLISIVSHSVPHLKAGVIRDMIRICKGEGFDWEKHYNRTDKILSVGLSSIEFVSIDKMKSHGLRRDYLYINEANAIPYEVFRQLFNRTKTMSIIDYNPIGEFWYNTEVLLEPDVYRVAFVHSTFRDNPYIPLGELKVLENAKKGTNFYRVYVEGKIGLAIGVIFEDWKKGEFDDTLPYVYGVDFGFTNPDSVTRVAVDEKKELIYLQQMHYKVGSGTQELVSYVKDIAEQDDERHNRSIQHSWQYKRYDVPFICDPADSRAIKDLRDAGINCPYFAKPEVVWSLRQMQNYTIILCGHSPDIERELNNYKWDESKSIPIKAFDHAIDGSRYGFLYLTGGKKAGNWYERNK